ncbi:hypothetical protein [Nocardia sp. NPDC049707]|uniref:hypothetical protein n=1 Tax=Nocardia sp. NPDC049707 TaxID=3154735 RepID=UPI00343B087F
MSNGEAVVRGLSVIGVHLVGDALVFELDNGEDLDPVTVPAIGAAAASASAAAASGSSATAAATAAQGSVDSFTLAIGAVSEGHAAATVHGGPPDWTLDLVLPPGPTGPDATPAAGTSSSSPETSVGVPPHRPCPPWRARSPRFTHAAADITDSTTTGRAVLTAASAAAVRTAIGAGTSSLAIGTVAGTACEGNDARLTNARTPTSAGQCYDFTIKSHAGTRAAGAGNVIPEGVRIERDISIQSVTFRGETAGTGNLVVELRRNGSNTGMPAASTISAANHAADMTVTAGGPWAVAAGDRIIPYIVTPDGPAGNGLQVSIKAITT